MSKLPSRSRVRRVETVLAVLAQKVQMVKPAPTTATLPFDTLPRVHPNAARLDIGTYRQSAVTPP
jgi:hypothetical protein